MFSRRSSSALRASLIVMFCAALFAGCASTRAPSTRIDYDKSADFSVYRTFGFPEQTGTDRGGYSTLVTSYFKNALSTALEARGYKYTEDHPDLLVNFFMDTRERTEIQSDAIGRPYGYYDYRYGLYSPWPMYGGERTVTHKIGSINIDIVDAAKKQLVWEGVSEGRLSQEAMANPRVTVNAVVDELMRQYPGRPNM